MTLRESEREAREGGHDAPAAAACGKQPVTAPAADATLARLIQEELSAACGFSIGCLGAIAEFHDPAAEICSDDGGSTAVSDRGAMRIKLRGGESALAYEALSAADDAWQYGIAVIAPRERGIGPARPVLTELHPDTDAIQARDRDALLFDLGVGMPNVDYCVRTAEPALIACLRRYAGQPVAQAGHPLIEAMIEASPHRVAVSSVGRIEVYQPIDRHKTPLGPHTHLLPALLARRRTHSANIPLPPRSVPLLTLHPENPLLDEEGRRRPFASAAYERFESVLAAYGLPEYVNEKQRLRAAISAGSDATAYRTPRSRAGRLAMRITLRQLLHVPPAQGGLERWLARYRR